MIFKLEENIWNSKYHEIKKNIKIHTPQINTSFTEIDRQYHILSFETRDVPIPKFQPMPIPEFWCQPIPIPEILGQPIPIPETLGQPVPIPIPGYIVCSTNFLPTIIYYFG